MGSIQSPEFSWETLKEQCLMTLERIYRRLGDRQYYSHGSDGSTDIRLSLYDYIQLLEEPTFQMYSSRATGYAADVLAQLERRKKETLNLFNGRASEQFPVSAGFENAVWFKWENVVEMIELICLLNMYEIPSFKAEMYLAETENNKPFCLYTTNKAGRIKLKTKRMDW